MVYLAIVFIAAAAGILRLWLQQRREKSQMETIDGFNTALSKISPETPVPSRRAPAPPRRRRVRARTQVRKARRVVVHRRSRPVPLDPDQRAAARRRIDARRRGHARRAS